MSKEKNKNTFRIGALLLVACLISSVMLSGTFAKYTSEYAGQDTALVARWSFGEAAEEELNPSCYTTQESPGSLAGNTLVSVSRQAA
jgi:hypothetical protein